MRSQLYLLSHLHVLCPDHDAGVPQTGHMAEAHGDGSEIQPVADPGGKLLLPAENGHGPVGLHTQNHAPAGSCGADAVPVPGADVRPGKGDGAVPADTDDPGGSRGDGCHIGAGQILAADVSGGDDGPVLLQSHRGVIARGDGGDAAPAVLMNISIINWER